MARYALIDADGLVTNVIEWDGETLYEPPAGASLVAAPDDVGPGDRQLEHGWEKASPDITAS